jgi:diguanylate cyclase (GGDEF)-like protein/PAS domain S-box-containing protein
VPSSSPRWDIRLSDETFANRHRALLIVVWLTVPLLLVLVLAETTGTALSRHLEHGGTPQRILVWLLVAGVVGTAVAGTMVHRRRPASLLVSTGLLLAAAALVAAGGGLTDLHFAFFVVLGLISVYQDWTVLALAVVLITAHHLAIGNLAPGTLYSDPAAANGPVRWTLLHLTFVLAMCAVTVAYWRFASRAQAEKDTIRAEGHQAVRLSEERFRAMVQDSADVIHVIDDDGRITSVSPAVERVTGHQPDQLVGTDYQTIIHREDRERLFGDGTQGQDRRVEVRAQHADGSWHWHDVTLRDLRHHPAVRGVVANHRDITERREFQELLMHEASHDGLTGLANRSAILRSLELAVTEADARSGQMAVLYLDLDRFKLVNDELGHDVGDALLVATARSLTRCVRGADTVGRLGGDEFAIALADVGGSADAAVVADRIVDELDRPVSVDGHFLKPRVSIGIAVSERGSDVDDLLRRADAAMYRAKRERGSAWREFVEGLDDRASDEATLMSDLRRATVDGQLRLYYQPIVDITESTVFGFEALVRWQHPTRGLLLPGEFIPLAEQTGLIDLVGAWVLRNACEQQREWQRRHPELTRLSLSVNIAPHQLEQSSLVTTVREALHDSGFDPHDLVLEVTESALVQDPSAVDRLNQLNALGIRIALDDFGTGYSSLRYLTRLPVDMLKLDRNFVAELNGTPEGSAVAESVIRLGQALHLDVVAEGVETRAQAAELALLGCRAGQGYLFTRPIPPDEVERLLAGATGAPVVPPRDTLARMP